MPLKYTVEQSGTWVKDEFVFDTSRGCQYYVYILTDNVKVYIGSLTNSNQEKYDNIP